MAKHGYYSFSGLLDFFGLQSGVDAAQAAANYEKQLAIEDAKAQVTAAARAEGNAAVARGKQVAEDALARGDAAAAGAKADITSVMIIGGAVILAAVYFMRK